MERSKTNVETITDYKVEEAIRRLSVNISNSYPEAHAVLISSVAGKEGKSFISLQLARVLAGRGSKTIYVNADLRAGSSDNIGLSEYMQEEAELSEIICETNQKNLHAIHAGKKKGIIINEIFMEKLLKELRQEYEYIIVDSSSLGEVADGMIIGKFCDGILLVLEPGVVEAKKIQRVKEEIERNGCKIFGVVLNKDMR